MLTEHDDTLDILVIRLGALGDVANVIRAVAALRRSLPEARIAWLVEEGARDLVDASSVAERILVFPRRRLAHLFRRPWRWPAGLVEGRRFIRQLRGSRYDWVLDFQGNLKGGMLGMLSGCRNRVGFDRGHSREGNWLFNHVAAVPSSVRMPRAEKFAALAQVVAPDLELGDVELREDADAAAGVGRFLAEEVPGDGPLVVIHPGVSDFGEFKRWPAERFGKVARRLSEEMSARCVVTQGPGEAALAHAVADAAGGVARVAPLLPIPGLIALLRGANVVIAADTGPLHIAALLRKPVVGIFTAKDPVIYTPYGTRCEIVRAGVACSPCTRRKCTDLRCVDKISVGDVVAAVGRLRK